METTDKMWVEIEREAAKIARDKAIYQYEQCKHLRARLARVVAWANARLSLDGFDPQDTPFHMACVHAAAWDALEPGDLDPIEQRTPDTAETSWVPGGAYRPEDAPGLEAAKAAMGEG